jgi:hypothetical protein
MAEEQDQEQGDDRPWDGIFEGAFGPLLPKGVAYGGRRHHRWDLKRAHAWVEKKLAEYERRRADVEEALEALRQIDAELDVEESFENWAPRMERLRAGREQDRADRDAERQRRRDERMALIAARRLAPDPEPPQPPAVTTLGELAAWVRKIADDPERLPAEVRHACRAWERGPSSLTDEQRAAGCGWCNPDHVPLWFATACLDHAWSRVLKPYVHACRMCGRPFVGKQAFGSAVCDDLCRAVARNERRVNVRAENRNGRACEVCGSPIDAGRSDARYCSSAHRQKAYRERGRA